MKGLELSESFYREHGEKMLHENFSEIEQYLAVGLIGSGSECCGYDDELSRDHDFEPGFCIFIPDESFIDSKTEFLLERAYSKLPKEYMGYKRSQLSPVGGNRHGVIRLDDFFTKTTGNKNAVLSLHSWLTIPEQYLIEATNGKIFCDNLGLLTLMRKKLSYLPEDVRLKKLAGNLLLMAQAGQYNYPRCIKRQDTASAQLSVTEFVNAALKVIFLLNKKYIPYYKWVFHALEELSVFSDMKKELEYLISSGNNPAEAEKKRELIEKLSLRIIERLKAESLTKGDSPDLEKHAYNVNNSIKDPELRNMNILSGV